MLKTGHTGPCALIGGAECLEYSKDLIDFRLPFKQRFFGYHFGEDAANSPNIDGSGVLGRPQQNFRSSIPEGDDFVGVGPDWDWKCSCEAEITDLQLAWIRKMKPFLLISKLAGFKSRWIILFMWQSAIPERSWNINFWVAQTDTLTVAYSMNLLGPKESRYVLRSCSPYSKTK